MTATTATQYLDPQTLASVGSVELRARMIVEGLMTGMHRSPMQGFSVEFAQHRQYAPGDDTRFLDWKVYGKTDKLYLKQYQKETNLDLMLLVDVSGSMQYSSRPIAATQRAPGGAGSDAPLENTRKSAAWRKYDHAASLAAAMVHLALRQQDRVGLMLFDRGVERATRMSNAQDHWRTICDILQAAGEESHTTVSHEHVHSDHARKPASRAAPAPAPGENRDDLTRVFDQVAAKLPRRSLVVLISDLFDSPAVLERGLARLHHRRHDVIVLQVMDPAELEFPFRSPSEFLGLEGEGRLPLDPAALRDSYLSVMREHLRAVQAISHGFRFDHLLLNTAEPLGPTLSHFLAQRASRAGRQ